ncbi:hypothetical protein H6P81_012196 [Aristolochia fimbriata]|nr:hypothetical protein H6P81_012196 [Aristolochia fimbriata]
MAQFPPPMRQSVVKRSKKYLEEALYNRLFRQGSSDKSVRTEVNQFLKSHKRVYKWEVGMSVKKLRARKRYGAALKLSEAMAKRGMNLTVSDHAIQLDLVAKTRDISAAEKYFMDLPESAKNQLCYGALLNCYCKDLMTEKAEALMAKMKELRFASSSMAYNSLMTLYTKASQPEKIPSIIQDMKAADVMPDCYTYNVWMRGLAAVNDIDGFEKAEMALKTLEKKNHEKGSWRFPVSDNSVWRIGNLVEVYRVWRSLKLAFPKVANISYLNMIQVLVNLNDLPGAVKCFKEWESSYETYDIRIANALIGGYTKADMLDEAEKMKNHAIRRKAKPNSKTWEIFMDYYLRKENVEEAVKCIRNAIEAGRGDGGKWVPSRDAIHQIMSHFLQEKDVEGAEGLLEILDKAEYEKGEKVFESLIRTYAAAGQKSPLIRRRLKMEKIEVSYLYSAAFPLLSPVLESSSNILLNEGGKEDRRRRLLAAVYNNQGSFQAILAEEERLVIIRFGHDWDETCMQMDEVLASVAETIKNFAVIYLVDITEVPDFNTMYELYDPSTVMFFFRNKHIMIDLGTGNNNKINWALKDKQEFIDIVETVYRGARKGRGLVIAPKDYSTKYRY